MLKVKILKTGEVEEVSRNTAFGLVDSGQAVYVNRQMKSERPKQESNAGKSRRYKAK